MDGTPHSARQGRQLSCKETYSPASFHWMASPAMWGGRGFVRPRGNRSWSLPSRGVGFSQACFSLQRIPWQTGKAEQLGHIGQTHPLRPCSRGELAQLSCQPCSPPTALWKQRHDAEVKATLILEECLPDSYCRITVCVVGQNWRNCASQVLRVSNVRGAGRSCWWELSGRLAARARGCLDQSRGEYKGEVSSPSIPRWTVVKQVLSVACCSASSACVSHVFHPGLLHAGVQIPSASRCSHGCAGT